MFRATFRLEDYLLTNEDARRLVLLRNAYDYPAACMRLSKTPTEFPLATGLWAKPYFPKKGEITDQNLDSYHTKLLTSPNPVDKLLGTLSIVFWGFYTWSPEIALIRARRHLFGYRSRPASTPTLIAVALDAMLAATNLGEGLAALAGISQLGRMPFASKVFAHLRPELTGVMDTQLYKGLKGSDWAEGASFTNILGGVHEKRCQVAFQAWADFLQCIAEQMNAGIDAGLPWHWQTPDGVRMRWRAVDVERAMFKYYILTNSNPAELSRLFAQMLTSALKIEPSAFATVSCRHAANAP